MSTINSSFSTVNNFNFPSTVSSSSSFSSSMISSTVSSSSSYSSMSSSTASIRVLTSDTRELTKQDEQEYRYNDVALKALGAVFKDTKMSLAGKNYSLIANRWVLQDREIGYHFHYLEHIPEAGFERRWVLSPNQKE